MSAATSITVWVPLTIRRPPSWKAGVTSMSDGTMPAIAMRAGPALVKALARGARYQKLLARIFDEP
jgi:hypothetical protein